MKKAIIIVTSVVLALLVALGVFIYWCFGTREFISHDIEKYETLIKHFDFLPSLEDLGEYEDVYYKYFERQLGALFESHAHTLRVVYNEDEFIKHKNIIEENYSFRETVKDLRGDDLVERKTSFTIDTFEFRMLFVDSVSDYGMMYPQQFVYIGVSDELNEIAYVFYDNTDLDIIGSSYEEFLIEECGWETEND